MQMQINDMNENAFLDKLFTIVVNWKLPSDTIDCVQSLFDANATDGQILVVDNGSGDDSVERIKNAFGNRIQLLESDTNLGFAGGNNWAIEQALTQGAEWILLANNDTVVAPTFFNELKKSTNLYPDYLLIAPLIFYYETKMEENTAGEQQPHKGIIWSLGDKLVPGTLATRGLFRNKPLPEKLPDFIDVDFLNACGLLIHRDVFDQIGTFDQSYFMYAEDVDLCWRAQLAGFKLGCATRAHMWHKVTRSTGINHPAYRYWRISNQIRFYRQYATFWQKPIMFCFTILHIGKSVSVDILAGRFQIIPPVVRAWFDGWFRKKPVNIVF